eukprot:SAG31_NODE_148_length_22511_cov_20.369266_7_plen_431_part_00
MNRLVSRLESARSTCEFLFELRALLERIVPPSSLVPTMAPEQQRCNGHEGYGREATLVAELEKEVGWRRVVAVDQALDSLVLSVPDAAGRQHNVQLQIPERYPAVPPWRCVMALPLPVELQWGGAKNGSNADVSASGFHMDSTGRSKGWLVDVLRQLDLLVNKCQELFAELDDIDNQTIVLDPERPKVASAKDRPTINRSYTFRRIAVLGSAVDPAWQNRAGKRDSAEANGNEQRLWSCSLEFTLTVENPRALPANLHFFGPESSIGPLRMAANQRLQHWQPNRSVLDNLEAVLQVRLRCDGTDGEHASAEDLGNSYQQECAICYTYRLAEDSSHFCDQHDSGAQEQMQLASHTGAGNAADLSRTAIVRGAIPDEVCQNEQCGRSFHHRCLAEWLRAIPGHRQSFGTNQYRHICLYASCCLLPAHVAESI